MEVTLIIKLQTYLKLLIADDSVSSPTLFFVSLLYRT